LSTGGDALTCVELDPKFYSGFLTLILNIHPIQAISSNHSPKGGGKEEKKKDSQNEVAP
jgi:hypothetical protein